jgi:hypothetical protein
MNIVRSARCFFIGAVILSTVAVSRAAAEEDFNWTEGAKFVDGFPFKQAFIDSLAAACGVAFSSTPLRTVPQQVFSKGEVLVYDIGWGIIKGGYVILTATPDTAHRTLRLGGKALSRGFVSTFYRMRDYVISTVDAAGLYPLVFEEHLREGKHYKSDNWVIFDNVNDTLHAKGRPVKKVGVPEFTNDYLSVLYLARTRKFAPGDTFTLPFFVDGKFYYLLFSCKGRETLEFGGKNVRCLVTQPQPKNDNGAFNKKKRLEIWFSDDSLKLPIKIKAKIAIGSITANLIHRSLPKSEPPPAAKPRDTAKTPAPDSSKRRDSAVQSDTIRSLNSAIMVDSLKTRDSIRCHDTGKTPDSLKKNDTTKKHDSAATPGCSKTRSP